MILFVLITIPLAAALLSFLTRRERIESTIALIAAMATLALSVRAALNVITSPGHIVAAIPGWIALDAPGALILIPVAFVNMTAALFSIGYMKHHNRADLRRYYLNFNLFVFSMIMVPLVQEPNIIWIAVELTTLFSVLLVGFENSHEALEAAWKYVVLTVMGAAIALLGFLILFWAAQRAGIEHYTWAGLAAGAPRMSPVLLRTAFALILLGFGAKAGLVPLHTWLPDAHSQAPTPVCALLSGVKTTAVLYAILRLVPILRNAPGVSPDTWMLVFGLISAGTAAFLLVQVKDYKRLFAFSTIEHMGIILTAVGLGGVSASSAAMLQITAHAVTKSFCFYAAGSVLLLTGTREIAEVRSLITRAPGAGVALLFGGLAIAGAPPFAIFMSEFSILKAGLHRGEYVAVGLLLLFIAVAFFAIMNHVSRMVFGSAPTIEGEGERPEPLPLSCRTTMIFAAVPILVLGIFIPGPLEKLITLAATTLGG
ncbi:MAG: hydrogenase 4 subunit F [Deltaproteobacteria bacterium]|nr:hydrogenase 4 subunit F [Deltaproteobacteria bacterium]